VRRLSQRSCTDGTSDLIGLGDSRYLTGTNGMERLTMTNAEERLATTSGAERQINGTEMLHAERAGMSRNGWITPPIRSDTISTHQSHIPAEPHVYYQQQYKVSNNALYCIV
jgi:hypothetical protein